jgi:ABC-type sugar transport system substrate-binding protein
MRLLRSMGSPGAWTGWALAVLALVLSTVAGCGSDAFAPPPPPELNAVPTLTTSTAVAPSVEMIVCGPGSPERLLWETAARQEAGRLKVILRITRLQAGDPPAAEAELVRRAAGRKASVLMVEPLDDPVVAAALNDARAGGTPVLTLGRKVPSRDPARPLASVTFTPYEETARKVVDTFIRDARARGLAGGHALIPVNTRSDPGRDEQVALLTRLLHDSGIVDVKTIPFDDDENQAREALANQVRSDPKVTLILAHEDKGLRGSVGASDDVRDLRELALGGFAVVDKMFGASTLNRSGVVADRNIPVFIQRALQLADRLARGEATDNDVVVPMPLHLSDRVTDRVPGKGAPSGAKPIAPKSGR